MFCIFRNLTQYLLILFNWNLLSSTFPIFFFSQKILGESEYSRGRSVLPVTLFLILEAVNYQKSIVWILSARLHCYYFPTLGVYISIWTFPIIYHIIIIIILSKAIKVSSAARRFFLIHYKLPENLLTPHPTPHPSCITINIRFLRNVLSRHPYLPCNHHKSLGQK